MSRPAAAADLSETTCACGAPGEVRVVDPDGAYDVCALHAIALVGSGGARVTVFLDVAEQRR
ncbi:MAG: hypothetical protein L0I76_30490 [Pseudonocardia sp.]|nr:hypothetical protein [Pseudonocardia sp.]